MYRLFLWLISPIERLWLIKYCAREIANETATWSEPPSIAHAGLLLQRKLRIHGIELLEMDAYAHMRKMLRGE